MFIVHHLNNSRSQRVLWLLEELGLDYEIRHYKRNLDMSAPDEMKRIHPLGKSPIVGVIDDSCRMTLVETGAICEYLVESANGRLGAPGDCESSQRYRQFLHYAEGSIMPLLFALLVVSKIPLLGVIAARKIRPMLDLHLDYVERELSERRWFAGDTFTAADVMMSFPLEAAAKWSGRNANRPATSDWLKRIHARDAFARALQKGGQYVLAR
ncbi:glutathione S-transferase [Rhizobium cauense]|uniref:glutathione S-transferase family protein n=1 Tax=Rhizobium cauense TaxID=1166683 RepID=UPI001C6F20C4|nr:glutathione S-transferase [Rhizobium cauense]MBW9117641.1 glutathione S-transferase [Rhizobium cauense]